MNKSKREIEQRKENKGRTAERHTKDVEMQKENEETIRVARYPSSDTLFPRWWGSTRLDSSPQTHAPTWTDTLDFDGFQTNYP